MKTAIILGATGLTGGYLLDKLLSEPNYSKVILFSRSSVNCTNPKLVEHLVDLFKLKDYKEQFKADEVFCCIGTTQKKTPDEETYRNIDYGIPVRAAELCKLNNIPTFSVISALGADPNSKMFYNRTKGEMEEEVLKQGIKNTQIFQPALIAGDRDENRFFESIAKSAMSLINPLLIGPVKKYRSIHPKTIATAMHYCANNNCNLTRIESDKIVEIAEEQK
jgi:uncharacterized protein YbjT (DUF2867 family)